MSRRMIYTSGRNMCFAVKSTLNDTVTKEWKSFSKKTYFRAKKNASNLTSPLNQNEQDDINDDNDSKSCTSVSNVQSAYNKIYIEIGSSDIPGNFEQIFRNRTPTLETGQEIIDILKEDKDSLKENAKECVKTHGNARINEINIQMLPESLHQQIFKSSVKQEKISQEEIQAIKHNLGLYGIKVEDATRLSEVDIKIPPLEGRDIEEHFYNIGMAQIKPYVNIIKKIINCIPEMPKQWVLQEGWTRYTPEGAEPVDYPLEDGIIFDVEVCMKEGPLPTLATAVTNKAWYGWVSKSLTDGSSKNFEGKQFTVNELIPMESTAIEHGEKLSNFHEKPKIIVGHNVSFDRSRIKEQYWLKNTGLRFLDTMSLHICIGGINSYQRSVLRSKGETEEKLNLLQHTSENSLSEIHRFYCGSELSKESRNLFLNGSLTEIKQDFNHLMDYCANDVIATHNVLRRLFPLFEERFPHPVTLAGMLELSIAYLPINSNWLRYLNESESAYEDMNQETKFILAKRANAVCELMHDEKYKKDLWMWDEDWSTQQLKLTAKYRRNNKKRKDKEENAKSEEKDNEKRLTEIRDEEEEEDPLEKEFAYLNETRKYLPAKPPHMPGYPAWYRKLCSKKNIEDWSPGPQDISTSMQIVPKLLNLTWENYPLHHIKEKGWGILVPCTNNKNIQTKIPLKELLDMCPMPETESEMEPESDDVKYEMSDLNKNVEKNLHKPDFWYTQKKKKNKEEKKKKKKKKSFLPEELERIYKGSAVWCNTILDNCCYFMKLPHKDGKRSNVGSPMSKDFFNKFSENVLAGWDSSASEILKNSKIVSYWRNNRKRIMSQFAVWFDNSDSPSNARDTKRSMNYGAIIPMVVVCGTLTRRAVEPTWMTASNIDSKRVGSELRAMIQAPPGYNIVGADVDSQELWISSMLGDAHYKQIHGATPFGWMTLMGTKSNGTDMHSVTAKAVGISRSQAKIINYARIYGAGQKFAETLLKQFNPCMTDAEATSKSRKMFTMTKGKKVLRLRPEFRDQLPDVKYRSNEAFRLSRLQGKTTYEVFENSGWTGGSESEMFNRLEEIANSPNPVTPFLNSRLTRALESQQDKAKYLPTKVNWVVQSGAVDFLHLMLVSMRWLMKDNARFCLSFHDEVRYLVPSSYKYNAALAMHVTNLLTRSFCASRVGMKDLPFTVAFFSSVDIDTVLRKESDNDCVTPSNPYGLRSGYEIPNGESLDVWTAVEKSNGSLGSWHEKKREE